jgi:hypothetical protein
MKKFITMSSILALSLVGTVYADEVVKISASYHGALILASNDKGGRASMIDDIERQDKVATRAVHNDKAAKSPDIRSKHELSNSAAKSEKKPKKLSANSTKM